MAEPLPVALLGASPLWDGLDGGTLVVAVSGGRDSVALARAAHALLHDDEFCARFSAPPALWLWHMDHGLRPESESDAEFVRRLSLALDVECEIYHAELAEELANNGGNVEELAREERYRVLLERLDNPYYLLPLRPPAVAATAHHLGDQAETILFNLVRGTHLKGLRGIARVRDGRIHRPWLALAPQAIEDYLRELGQDWVEDPTNADTRLARNKLRHEVLPRLLELNPLAREHVARLADTAATALKYIRRELAQLPVESFTEQAVDRWLPLLGWPRGGYDAYRLDGGWDNAELLAQFAADRLTARRGALASADYDRLTGWALAPAEPLMLRDCRLARPHPRVFTIATEDGRGGGELPRLALEFGRTLPVAGLSAGLSQASADEWRQRRQGVPQPWERIRDWPQLLDELTASPPHRPGWYCFLPASVKLPLTLRAWRAGDRLALAAGTKKVGDVFTDAKVPACFRPVWAVLADSAGEVLWVPGLADGRAMQLSDGEQPAYVVALRESG